MLLRSQANPPVTSPGGCFQTATAPACKANHGICQRASQIREAGSQARMLEAFQTLLSLSDVYWRSSMCGCKAAAENSCRSKNAQTGCCRLLPWVRCLSKPMFLHGAHIVDRREGWKRSPIAEHQWPWILRRTSSQQLRCDSLGCLYCAPF